MVDCKGVQWEWSKELIATHRIDKEGNSGKSWKDWLLIDDCRLAPKGVSLTGWSSLKQPLPHHFLLLATISHKLNHQPNVFSSVFFLFSLGWSKGACSKAQPLPDHFLPLSRLSRPPTTISQYLNQQLQCLLSVSNLFQTCFCCRCIFLLLQANSIEDAKISLGHISSF